MTPLTQVNVALDDDDRERLERLTAATGWTNPETLRQALVALDRGMERYHARLRGQLPTGRRAKNGRIQFEPKPDARQADLYARVVRELGYDYVLKNVTFGHGEHGDPEVTIDGYIFTDGGTATLRARRQVITADGEYLETFEVKQGGLRPRARLMAQTPS